jgi:rhamnosyltransferase
MKTASIVTTYNPDRFFMGRIQTMIDSCDYVIVCDNTPGGHIFDQTNQKVVILKDGINKGLGAALNAGLERAHELNVDLVHLFDQDSSPSSSLLKKLQLALLEQKNIKCCIAPNHVDDALHTPQDELECCEIDAFIFKQYSCLATSGMTFFINKISSKEDFFDETILFLDFVDFEWCWRMAKKGWMFKKIINVTMLHRLGNAQRSFFGLKYHVPSPFRHYYQFRDSIKISKISYVPLYSKIRLLILLPIKLLIYPVILDSGIKRLGWMLMGIRDSLINVKGVGAAGRLLK